MENVNTSTCYNLVDSKGNKLQLKLGYFAGGLRWCLIGTDIPMPVRSGTWFHGFSSGVMLDWLKANGWSVQSSVNMTTGYAHVYELPKGNEETIATRSYPIYKESDRAWFYNIIRDLMSNNQRVSAAKLYRYAHGGTLLEASKAVMEICNGNG